MKTPTHVKCLSLYGFADKREFYVSSAARVPRKAMQQQQQSASGRKPAVRQSVFQVLACPLCREYMIPPITLCQAGHNICSSCRPGLQFSGGNKCPHCGQPLLETRNVALETIARGLTFPCRYKDAGCLLKFNANDIRKHHGQCPHRSYDCPLRALGRCQWNGRYVQYTYTGWKVRTVQIYRVEVTYCTDIQGGRYVLCRYTGWKVRTVQIYRVECTYCTDIQGGRYVLYRYTGWKVRTVQIYRVEGTYCTDIEGGRYVLYRYTG